MGTFLRKKGVAMTDIVGRLPPLKPLPDCMMPDGAQPCVAFSNLEAEITRLQGVSDVGKRSAYIRHLEAEIKRLLAERDELFAANGEAAAIVAKLEAEIERLRANVLQEAAMKRNLDAEAAIIINDISSMVHRIEMLQASPHYTAALRLVQKAYLEMGDGRAEILREDM